MNVLVERYLRKKNQNQKDSKKLYYMRQKPGEVRVMDIDKISELIQSNCALTKGDVKHALEAFVEQLRESLTQGNKVKIDGMGTFHITLSSNGSELEKDCSVKSIRRVYVRFVPDKTLKLVNSCNAATRSANNVEFAMAKKDDDSNSGSGNGSGTDSGSGSGSGSGTGGDSGTSGDSGNIDDNPLG